MKVGKRSALAQCSSNGNMNEVPWSNAGHFGLPLRALLRRLSRSMGTPLTEVGAWRGFELRSSPTGSLPSQRGLSECSLSARVTASQSPLPTKTTRACCGDPNAMRHTRGRGGGPAYRTCTLCAICVLTHSSENYAAFARFKSRKEFPRGDRSANEGLG